MVSLASGASTLGLILLVYKKIKIIRENLVFSNQLSRKYSHITSSKHNTNSEFTLKNLKDSESIFDSPTKTYSRIFPDLSPRSMSNSPENRKAELIDNTSFLSKEPQNEIKQNQGLSEAKENTINQTSEKNAGKFETKGYWKLSYIKAYLK